MAKIDVEVKGGGTAEDREDRNMLVELMRDEIKGIDCPVHGADAKATVKLADGLLTVEGACCNEFSKAMQEKVKGLLE